MKKIFIGLVVLLMGALPAMAQPEEAEPGITPDSPFYFLDRVSDAFQSPMDVQNEKAAEVEAMAKKGKEKAVEKSVKAYERSSERVRKKYRNDSNRAEEAARQASFHLGIFSELEQNFSEHSKAMRKAINTSARERVRAIGELNKTNPQRASSVAESTLEEVMANTPEQAQKGLSNALEKVRGKHKMERGRGRNETGEKERERNRTHVENKTPQNKGKGETTPDDEIPNKTENKSSGMEEGEETNGQKSQNLSTNKPNKNMGPNP